MAVCLQTSIDGLESRLEAEKDRLKPGLQPVKGTRRMGRPFPPSRWEDDSRKQNRRRPRMKPPNVGTFARMHAAGWRYRQRTDNSALPTATYLYR